VPAATSAFPWSDEVAFLKEIVLKLPAGASGGTGPDLLWARFLQHGGWWPSQAPAPVAVKTGNPPNAAVTPPAPQGDPAQYPFELHPFPHVLLGVGGGANIPWLQGSPEPLTSIAWQTWACIHPDAAKTLGVQKGDVVRLTTPFGEVEAEVYVTPVIRADTIAIPFGQGHEVYGRYAENRGANAVHLLGGQPGPGGLEPNWAGLRCRVTPTGQTARVATLEFTPGVEAGFFNKSFPGQ
jgi:menaquinone reductase, molybdopterin-binding-like subunit